MAFVAKLGVQNPKSMQGRLLTRLGGHHGLVRPLLFQGLTPGGHSLPRGFGGCRGPILSNHPSAFLSQRPAALGWPSRWAVRAK